MPVVDGTEATRSITATCPGTRVVCLSMHADREFITAALEAGASGYLLKESAVDELELAIRAVGEGGVYLSPRIAGSVVDGLRAAANGTPSEIRLTPRETEVLRWIGDGLSTKEIGAELGVSVKTVSTHRDHLMEKLGEHTIAGLVRHSIRRGLVAA